jgi:integrase
VTSTGDVVMSLQTDYRRFFAAARNRDGEAAMALMEIAKGVARTQWSWIDWMNRVIRVPRTKNNKAHAVSLNATAYDTFKRLFAARDPELDSAYVFGHARDTRHARKPVLDVKNAFTRSISQ